MALCEYAAQVGGRCGVSAENPGSSQCMSIAKCDKDIRSHLRSFGAGFADSTVKTEAGLLLPRVPEDIFFLSILMVGGEVALTRKKITSGHRSTQPHFHVRNQFRI